MSLSMPYPAQLEFHGDRHIRRWRPLVQWLLAIPQLMIAGALNTLRDVLTVVSFFTVLFTKQVPQALFDVMAMTYRYNWRAASYALFLHEDYPPFDFEPAAVDDGVDTRLPTRSAFSGGPSPGWPATRSVAKGRLLPQGANGPIAVVHLH